MEAVFSESLQYGQMKKRSVAARSFRVKIPPTNGTTFSPDSTIQIDLAGNLAGQYYDFSSMYLKFNVSSSAACVLDRAGGLSFIKRLQISTAGAQICDINNWNLLATSMMDTDASSEWKAGYGNILLGTHGDSLRGVAIPAGGNRTFCVPLVLNPLFNTTPHRLIPAFSLSSLQIRATLDSAQSAVSAVAATTLLFRDVELVCMMTELSPAAQSQVDAATGGKYNILANSFMNSQATLGANAGLLTSNLGFSMSSLERIVAIHRTQASVISISTFSLGNRTTSGLAQFQYLINSESYPARPVLVDVQGAESTAEFLIADHSLVDWNKGSGISNGVVAVGTLGVATGAMSGVAPDVVKSLCFMQKDVTGYTAGASAVAGSAAVPSDIGTYVIATDFENGLSVGKSATIYSGVSTIASNVQWLGTYAAANVVAQVDFFAQYSVLISLDMRGSGVYSVSI
jgi:hypothetical protein